MKKNKLGWPEAIRDSIGWIAIGWIVFSISSCVAHADDGNKMYRVGTKDWCTVNTEWNITECLYDTKEECQRCAFVDGEGGLHTKEYCTPLLRPQ